MTTNDLADPVAPDTRAALLEAAVAELVATGRADISLRAVARRAGVSHAAPGYFFGDRAGLLTAVAAGGFRDIAARLHEAADPARPDAVADYGEVYVGFALEQPAVFDLMFASPDLRHDDEDLDTARTAALAALDAAVRASVPGAAVDPHPVATATLVSWSFAHGVALLLRAGVLQAAAGGDEEPAVLARRLVATFSQATTTGA